MATPDGSDEKRRRGIFGARRRADELEVELARLTELVRQLGGMDDLQREQHRQAAERRLAQTLAEEQQARGRVIAAEQELARARADLVETESDRLLQAAGVYNYTHPLEDAVAYKAELASLRQQIKASVTARTAVRSVSTWHVNGSAREGTKMVKDFSTLMLRAYNAEADNCVRTVKPHSLRSVVERLDKTRATITKLGKTMAIEVNEPYHRLRMREIELTADYLSKVEEEREAIRAQRERDREDEAARREFEREKARLLKEQAHYVAALQRLEAQGKTEEAAVLAAKLAEVGGAIESVDARAANIRTGYVYVISNVGAFGEEVVKVGMTRRLDPMDRVRELGDASVPFRFDVHALVFSNDAVALEGQLHAALAERRVNRVNLHREFFRARPAEVRDLLAGLAGNHLLEFQEAAEALEWRASGSVAVVPPLPPEPVSVRVEPEPEDWIAEDGVAAPAEVVLAAKSIAPGESVALNSIHRLRLVLSGEGDDGGDWDPFALLLTAQGEVTGDEDVIYFGQPDHPSGAASLAATETGDLSALHIDTAQLPTHHSEVLLVALAEGASGGQADLIDTASGRGIGRLQLPGAGPSGVVQLGALQRSVSGWSFQAEPAAIDMSLPELLRAAGVSVEDEA